MFARNETKIFEMKSAVNAIYWELPFKIEFVVEWLVCFN